jgi:hypothetical protein
MPCLRRQVFDLNLDHEEGCGNPNKSFVTATLPRFEKIRKLIAECAYEVINFDRGHTGNLDRAS